MIPARKGPLFAAWFAGVSRRRLFGAFSSVRVRGLDAVVRAAGEGPVLVVSNHTSWWDPLVVIWLTTSVMKVDPFAMMDARNLRRLPFFAKVGAFGVDLEDAADGARAIRYAAKLLDRPGRLVWVFAQGREVPVTVRPLAFRGGSAQIARVAHRATVVPAAMRYEHGGRPEPSLFVSFGPPLAHPRERDLEALRSAQEQAVERELERIDRALVAGDDEFDSLFERGTSWLGTAAERALAWLTRPRLPG